MPTTLHNGYLAQFKHRLNENFVDVVDDIATVKGLKEVVNKYERIRKLWGVLRARNKF